LRDDEEDEDEEDEDEEDEEKRVHDCAEASLLILP
jgi:hypothetical protein